METVLVATTKIKEVTVMDKPVLLTQTVLLRIAFKVNALLVTPI
jgi:hypothetical protein